MTNLERATYRMAEKFRRGGPGSMLPVDYQLHMAVLVSFPSEGTETELKMHRQRRYCVENEKEYLQGLQDSFLAEEDEGDKSDMLHVMKKRKGTGKVPKGHDFWSELDLWFATKVQAWGSNKSARAWEE